MAAISYARPCPVVIIGAVSAGHEVRLSQGSFRGMTPSEPPGVTITLSSDEALVLYDWLERIIKNGDLERLVPDPPEWFALLRLSGVLEETPPWCWHVRSRRAPSSRSSRSGSQRPLDANQPREPGFRLGRDHATHSGCSGWHRPSAPAKRSEESSGRRPVRRSARLRLTRPRCTRSQ